MKPSTALERSRLFVDTWGWIVLADQNDPSHRQVFDLRRRSLEDGGVWVSTDYVLDELITRLFSTRHFAEAEAFCASIFEAQQDGTVLVERVTPERFLRAWRLRQRYRDKPRISFTDLTTFVVMQEAGIRDVLGKSMGSGNRLNVVKATLRALESLRTKEEVEGIRQTPV